MRRLLDIELYKLRHTRYFWVLLGLFILFLLAVPLASKALLMKIGGEETIQGLPIALDQLPLFDFVDIWQNLTFIYKSFSIFLGFILVISVCNEYRYGTIKQNVIDGLSQREFLLSKVLYIVCMSAIVSLAVVVIGLIMGFMWSSVTGLEYIVENIEFVGAYFLHLVAFQLFCLLVAMLIRRSGLVIALLIFYVYMIEPLITTLIKYHYDLVKLSELFPVDAMSNIIRVPFQKYALQETQTYVAFGDLLPVVVYIGLFYWLAHRLITRRDLA